MLDVKGIGKNIKALRKERGLSQGAFAEALGVSFQAVSGWERGIAAPDLENVVKIAAFFGVLTDDILRPQEAAVFLGIDGGGTKTEFVAVTGDGRVLNRFVKGPSNPNDVGFSEACEVIAAGIRAVLVKHSGLTAVYGGIAGTVAGDRASRMTSFLKEQFPSLTVTIKTDSTNLFGFDDGADLAVIAGTGSVVFVRQGDDFLRLGGWGYLFDTAGSAYDMGRDAVSAVNEKRYEALTGRVMNLSADVQGLKAQNKDAGGSLAELSLQVEGIAASVSRVDAMENATRAQLTKVEQTAAGLTVQVEKLTRDGTGSVTTAAGYTFDDSGLRIAKTGQEMENLLDNTGMYVKRSGEEILTASAEGVLATDVTVRNYLVIGSHARFEDYGYNRTACFYLAGEDEI